jgi:hypothetical protein
MTHMKRLILSRPFFQRLPDQTLIASNIGSRADYKTAVRARDGSYAMVYAPTCQTFAVDLTKLAGAVDAWWYNPKDGVCYDQDATRTAKPFARYPNHDVIEFAPPSDNPDWVLVLDDASRSFPPPGH